MKQSLLVLAFIVVKSFTLAWDVVGAEPQKARDLSLYDLAGPFSLDRSPRHAADQPIIEAAIREFLWTRWQRRRLAHVAVVQYGLEGRATRAWYFIEPDQNGVWRIIIDEDVTLPAFKRDSEEHLRETHRYEVYSLDRTDERKHDAASPRPIPDKEVRPAEEYRLRLKSRDGEVVRQL